MGISSDLKPFRMVCRTALQKAGDSIASARNSKFVQLVASYIPCQRIESLLRSYALLRCGRTLFGHLGTALDHGAERALVVNDTGDFALSRRRVRANHLRVLLDSVPMLYDAAYPLG